MARVPPQLKRLLQFDQRLQRRLNIPFTAIAGVDEVGRGPLAGPVVASAVLLAPTVFPAAPIDDSKRLSPSLRQLACLEILRVCTVGIGWVPPEEIDRIGIHAATHKAMLLALQRLPFSPGCALIDGPWVPPGCPVKALPIVGGDSQSLRIACASIVAKVLRDHWMSLADRLFPMYGFIRHKGYATKEHFRKLQTFGPSPLHRFSFHPLRKG